MKSSIDTADTIAEHASLLMWTLTSDDRWQHWYDPDRWGGRIGLANYVATAAVALEEQLAPRDWSDLDRYLTVDEVANAMLTHVLDTRDMSPYYVEIELMEPSSPDSIVDIDEVADSCEWDCYDDDDE